MQGFAAFLSFIYIKNKNNLGLETKEIVRIYFFYLIV